MMVSPPSASARLLRSLNQLQRGARDGAGPQRVQLQPGTQSAAAGRDAPALASDTTGAVCAFRDVLHISAQCNQACLMLSLEL